jgi:hypothetical protein
MSISKEFILAGKAIFTVECNGSLSPKPHYTFKVRRKEATLQYPETVFVSLLTGSDNNSSYTYLGILNPDTGAIRLTAKSTYREDSYPVRLLNRILARIWNNEHAAYEAAGFATHHENRCCKCGKRLTTPASVTAGIGPECIKMLAGV